MKIVFAVFECVPFVKVGGLADVAGTLPEYLRQSGQEIIVVLPLHKQVDKKKFKLINLNRQLIIPVGNEYLTAGVWRCKRDNSVPVYFIENDRYFGREPVYGNEFGEYPDNSDRLIFFNRSVFEICKSIGFKPDIIHCNDMQTGLIPAYLKTLYRIDSFFSDTKTVYEIHNIVYQGLYSAVAYFRAGFDWVDFTVDRLEYYGQVNFTKSGINYAGKIITVSPAYAREIQSSAKYGHGMEGILTSRSSDITGILNGIDYDIWNPEKDKFIVSNYSIKTLQGKQLCKSDLLKNCGLPDNGSVVIGMVSRLDSIKGFDLIIDIIDKIMELPVQLVILGSGNEYYSTRLKKFMNKYREKLSYNPGFNDELAHKIYAGSDIFLMPSETEPCGLSQLIALRYGTIPIVHKTGGLADTIDSEYGISFDMFNSGKLYNTIIESIDMYKDRLKWNKMITAAMKKRFSWDKSVKQYLKVYNSLI